ncbi:MAG TPA: LysM peptidoglycan-binding domain-containing protein [Oceanipulchritudo sp.]|nr:LysM peptidoglycan-binding domain-containing protein [Oceanipulchritudo sp.]
MDLGRKVKSLRALVLMVVACGFLMGMMAACSPSTSVTKETEERAYRRGKSLLREGRKEEALQAFLSVVNSRPDATESHLEAGLIYLNNIKDPLAAIYHFRNYLVLSPEGEYAEFVKELILTAQKDYAQTLPGEPFGDAVDRVNLMETVKKLQEENDQLKQTIVNLQRDLVEQEKTFQRFQATAAQQQNRQASQTEMAPIIIRTPNQPSSGTTAGRTYTVQPGDTLSKISTQVYGVAGRWSEIYEANRDQLPSSNALKPGQVLKIP